MFRNLARVAIRNLWRSKSFSTINILGLAIGMAAALLIGLWVQNEFSYDSFYTKADRTYLLYTRADYNGATDAWPRVSSLMAPQLKKDYPEVDDAVRFRRVFFLLTEGEKKINIEGDFADSGFLSVFDLPLLQGDPKTALASPQGIVLTEHVAKNLFGNEDPMGKMVRVDTADYFKVTGVLKDLPGNTEFSFQYLLPWTYVDKLGWLKDELWSMANTTTYVTLKPGASRVAFESKLDHILKPHVSNAESTHREIFTQPITRTHLYSKVENGRLTGGLITMVRLFAVIGIFILLIACINFMNLSTARSEKRAKEVGIRKVVGALKSSLVTQFIGESILLALLSFFLALGIVHLSLKPFNQLIHASLRLDWTNPYFWLASGAFVLFTGLVAGSYPAFYLSSFRPVTVLKGAGALSFVGAASPRSFLARNLRASVAPRKVLVVLQFSFAVILIISTIVVEKQIDYGRHRQVGYDRNGLVFTFVQGDVLPHYDAIKRDLLGSGAAIAVTKLYSPITAVWNETTNLSWPGSTEADKKRYFNDYESDADFIKTTGAKLIAGRDIDLKSYPTDSTAILLNETAVKMMRLKDPIGATIRNENGVNCHVVGVIGDFVMGSPYNKISAMIVQGLSTTYPVVHFRLNPAKSFADDLDKAGKIFKQYNPQYPFDYYFADEFYNNKFKAEQQQGTLGLLFAGLTIFISCLGLFGLASYMAETRMREIGIRKVLGASVAGIAGLMAGDFIKLVLIAEVIASPIAWYAMSHWLAAFDYRIHLDAWIFLSAGVLAILIALGTVSYQAVRSAIANPVHSLRSE